MAIPWIFRSFSIGFPSIRGIATALKGLAMTSWRNDKPKFDTIKNKNRAAGAALLVMKYQRISRLDRYLRTISATLKTMAWSNSRRSRPVSFLIFSRR